MALSVNQMYKNYYTIRLGTLTTQHQIQSNRILLYTNEVTDIAQRINFFENQKMLTLATPSGEKLAINATFFDLPSGFDPEDSASWTTDPKYMTSCQKQIYIYKKATDAEYAAATEKETFDGVKYIKIPYLDSSGKHTYEDGFSPSSDQLNITDSRVLSSKLMNGEYTFVYNNDSGENQKISWKDLLFVSEQQDETAYQDQIQVREGQSSNINEMQKKVQQEMSITETEIQAIQNMMESTDKILQKNTETFKWGA